MFLVVDVWLSRSQRAGRGSTTVIPGVSSGIGRNHVKFELGTRFLTSRTKWDCQIYIFIGQSGALKRSRSAACVVESLSIVPA
jgi:hypothetical protein